MPGRPKRHGRDCLDAAHDIRDLVTQIGQQKLGVGEKAIDGLRIFFVASSIGAAICRLSTIANSDTISLFADPQVPGFDVESLPDGVTAKICNDTRRILGHLYSSTSPNKEGL